MRRGFIVSGTDTDIGKTVFSAMLTLALDGVYFKPVQAGLDGETDTETVRRLTELPESRFRPERYRLRTPASPHLAAELDSLLIDPESLSLPAADRPLIVEGAGGLMVPLTDGDLLIDVFRRWRLPVILCARTALGTINHTLLSVEALRARDIPTLGIVFIGDDNPSSEDTIIGFAGVPRLGRLPRLRRLDRPALETAFAQHFDLADFT